MLDVRKLLAQRPLLFDGGMGTYYKAKPGQECEQANLTDPEGILAVHRLCAKMCRSLFLICQGHFLSD